MKKWVKVLLLVIIIISTLFLWSRYISTNRLKVKEYAIIDEKLPDNFNGLKIVHFSDILYGRTTNIVTIKKLVNEMNILKPDILIFTGDLFEPSINIPNKDKEKIIDELKKINTSIGAFAITGDSDKKEYESIMVESNFEIIDEEDKLIYFNGNTPIKITNKKDNVDNLFTIGLIHKPDEIDNMNLTNVNLVLAGHSLNGQIRIPFYGALIKRTGAKKYTDSYYELNNTKFYISSGIGTEDFSFRFNNKPSINLYRLTNY